MTRRQALSLAGAAAAVAAPGVRSRMGGTISAYGQHAAAARAAKQPFDLLEQCYQDGFGGVELRLTSVDPEAVRKVRQKLEAYGMFLVGDGRLPQQESDVAAFDATLAAYREAGASAIRFALTGRRYEVFDSAEAFQKHWAQCRRAVELAEPIARKHRVKLAIENHKDWRSQELAEWIRRVGSEYVAVCLDMGNNISLCEDPMDVVRTLAPYAVCCHIKDMALQEYDEGFLLADVPLGEGMLDLAAIVQTLRQANPNIPFDLEVITRDPLKVPCLGEKYWATFTPSFSPLYGRDLARTLALVRAKRSARPLPQISSLSQPDQVRAEKETIRKSIEYARAHLAL